MGKPPAFQFYVLDWMRDTRILSLAAKGAWIDLLCAMWHSETRGKLSMSIKNYSRLIGATEEKTKAVIQELIDMKICDTITLPLHVMDGNENVQKCNGDVTLINRRMVKEIKERELNRLRVRKFRKNRRNRECNGECNGNVTPLSSSSSSLIKKTSQTSLRLGELFFDSICLNNPKSRLKKYNPSQKEKTIKRWTEDIEKLIRIDEQTEEDVETVIKFCTQDGFEKANVLSGRKLRERWDSLIQKAEKAKTKGNGNQKAGVLWKQVLEILRKGTYRQGKRGPPDLDRIVQKMGGWAHLGRLSEKEIEFKKRDFMELVRNENH